jgi:hypothetical protein
MAMKNLTSGLPSSGFGVASGGAIFYGHRFANTKVQALQKNFWITPVLIAAVGHFLKTRKSDKLRIAGASMLGAAGYALAMGYEMNKASKAQSAPASDTGAMVTPADIQETGALMEPSDYNGASDSSYSYDDAMSL